MELILRAAAYAGEAHGTQTRKGSPDPYVTHPLRVGHAAALAGLSAEAVAASLLHDVIEDTPRTPEELAACFPERVVGLFELLTKEWADDAPPDVKTAGKPRYYGAIMGDDEAMAIKLLDRADNLRDMIRMLPRLRGWAERYLAKTEREIAPIQAACPNARAREEYGAAIADLHRALGHDLPER